MNKSLFYQYIHYPELLDERSLMEIKDIVAEYPYFQSAHLLHVKNLSNQGNINYDRELKKSAIWVTNRKKLFHLLDNRVLISVSEEKAHEANTPHYSDEDVDIIDFTALTEATAFNPEPITDDTSSDDDELSKLIMLGSAQAASHFNVSDKVDLEDFKNTFGKNSEDKTSSISKRDKKERRRSLIDDFIIEQPKIEAAGGSRSYFEAPIDDKISDDTTMITDTLAKIYIKQEKYEKAILAYEKLSLKYPEKNSYFVGQIKKIKQLINNK